MNKIYWTELGGDIIAVGNADGSGKMDLVTGLSSPVGLLLDKNNQTLYFSELFDVAPYNGGSRIAKVHVSGQGPVTDIFTNTEGDKTLFDIDFANQKVYWTSVGDPSDTIDDKIEVGNLNGTGRADLFTGLNFPEAIILDLPNQKIYWTEGGDPSLASNIGKIVFGNLDGSGSPQDIFTGLAFPLGFAIDFQNKKIYWAEYGSGQIVCGNLDGTGSPTPLFSGLSFPGGVALDLQGNKIYWSEGGAGKISRGNLDGTEKEDIFTGLNQPACLVLDFNKQGASLDDNFTPESATAIVNRFKNLCSRLKVSPNRTIQTSVYRIGRTIKKRIDFDPANSVTLIFKLPDPLTLPINLTPQVATTGMVTVLQAPTVKLGNATAILTTPLVVDVAGITYTIN